MMRLHKLCFWLLLAPAGVDSLPVRPPPDSSAASAVATFFRNAEGRFERAIDMAFPALPKIGDEIEIGGVIYRVVRILVQVEGGQPSQTQLFFERSDRAVRNPSTSTPA